MSEQITLAIEIASSKEACITWDIPGDLYNNAGKATLFLSDINQSSPNNSFFIRKYRILYNERENGSHTFTDLPGGNYVAKVMIMNTVSELFESSLFHFQVFDLAAPEFKNSTDNTGIIPGFKSFEITLKPLASPNNIAMEGGTVTFILFGQQVSQGVTQQTTRGAINAAFDYNSNNKYTINDTRLENDVEYEISCLYTNSNKCSSELSDSKIVRPTNLPTKVTNLISEYDSVNQTLKIVYDMPNNVAGYVPLNCRATITYIDSNLVEQKKYYNTNQVNVTGPIIFNMTNQDLLPTDKVFTITLAINNEYGYGAESDPISCIHPENYTSKDVLIGSDGNLKFTLTPDNKLKIENTYNVYNENTNYTVTYVSEIFECLAADGSFKLKENGSPEDPIIIIPGKTFPNGEYDILGYKKGTLYKYVLNVYYQKMINSTEINFGPKIKNTCYFYFVPHLPAVPLTLTYVPDDKKVTVNWNELTTMEELNGFIVYGYEYFQGVIVNPEDVGWIPLDKT